MQRRNAPKASVKAIVRKNHAKLFAYLSTTALFAILIFEAVKLA
jgi:hypothetical protein